MTPGSPIGDAGVIDRDAGIIALVCTVLHAFGRSPILVVSVICGRYAVSRAGGLDGFGRVWTRLDAMLVVSAGLGRHAVSRVGGLSGFQIDSFWTLRKTNPSLHPRPNQ